MQKLQCCILFTEEKVCSDFNSLNLTSCLLVVLGNGLTNDLVNFLLFVMLVIYIHTYIYIYIYTHGSSASSRPPPKLSVGQHLVKPTVGLYVTLIRWRSKYADWETSNPMWPLHHIPRGRVSMSKDKWPCWQTNDHVDEWAWWVPPVFACLSLMSLYMEITCTPCPRT